MGLKWTSKALSDLTRLYDFLASVNRQVAARTVQLLVAAPSKLIDHPRMGEKI
jgi:plasmid stabilization system protein ParE